MLEITQPIATLVSTVIVTSSGIITFILTTNNTQKQNAQNNFQETYIKQGLDPLITYLSLLRSYYYNLQQNYRLPLTQQQNSSTTENPPHFPQDAIRNTSFLLEIQNLDAFMQVYIKPPQSPKEHENVLFIVQTLLDAFKNIRLNILELDSYDKRNLKKFLEKLKMKKVKFNDIEFNDIEMIASVVKKVTSPPED